MFTRIVSVTAAIVVFVTTYALVLPAITMEIEADCGIEAHQHDDSCYEYGLICGLEESDQHQHGDGCYGRTGNLICGKEVHVHSEACYHRNEAKVMTGEISEPDDGSLMTAVPSDAGGVSAQSADVFMEEGISEDNGTYEENGDGSVDSAETFSDETVEDVGEGINTDANDVNDGNIEDGSNMENEAGTLGDGEAAEAENGEPADSGKPIENGEPIESGEAAAIETDDSAVSAEQSDIDGQNVQAEEEEYEEEFVPALDPVFFQEVLNDRTGIYYYHTPDGETVENSANITDWKKIRKDTELGENDLIRVYLAYTIPAGSLNATNGTTRYRLPANLHLSDGQVNAINQMENGIAVQYADYENLQILDTESYHKYLGAEAVDGTRTPDQSVDDYLQSLRSSGQAGDGADGSGVQEFISATVQVENIYDTDGSSGEKGALLGQDLIFTFSPYTIEENRHAYDSTGQQAKIGRDVQGWLTLDFNMQQVDWIEQESTVERIPSDDQVTDQTENQTADQTADQAAEQAADQAGAVETVESVTQIVRTVRTADIVFAAEETGSHDHRISEIHTELTLVTEKVETITEETENGSAEKTADSDDNGADADPENPEAEAADNEAEENIEDQDDEKPDADNEMTDQDVDPDQKDDETAEKTGDKEDDRNYPAQSFEDTITVRMGVLSTDAANDSAVAAAAIDNIEKKTELTVSVVAEKGTFPEGTTMVLTPVTGNDLDTVAVAVEGAVEGRTAGFHAVDISFRDAAGKELEPRKPIKVSMQSESIRQAVENPSTDPVIVHLEDSRNKNDGGDEHEDAKKDTNKDVVEGTSDDVEEDADNNAGEADRAEQIEEAGENAGEDVGVDTENGGNNELDRSTVTVTTVPGSADADNLTFESDSFSVYAIVYTVDFHYEVDGKTYEFSIPGGGFVSLERLVEVLGIGVSDARESSDSNQEAEVTENDADEANEKEGEQQETSNVKNQIIKLEEVDVSESAKKFVSDVEKVEFSSPDLVWVGKVNTPDTVGGLKKANDLIIEYSADLTEEQIAENNAQMVEAGDWALISIHPFTSEENLTVTMKNGEQFVVKVTDAQIRKTVIDAKGDTWEITVTYGEDAQIPDGAELRVREVLPEDNDYQNYYKQSLKTVGVGSQQESNRTESEIKSASDSKAEVKDSELPVNKYARIFDIEIWAGDSKIEPKSNVTVEIRLLDAPEKTELIPHVVHFAEEGTELMELTGKPKSNENNIQFKTDEFSVYSVIYTVDLHYDAETGTLFYEDNKIKVTVSAKEKGKGKEIFPEEAVLIVKEMIPDDADAADKYAQALTALSYSLRKQNDSFSAAKVYDFSILDKAGKEIEPNGAVEVKIEYKERPEFGGGDGNASEIQIAHLVEDPLNEEKLSVEIMNADIDSTDFGSVSGAEFTTDSFSAYIVFNRNGISETEPTDLGNYGWIRFHTVGERDTTQNQTGNPDSPTIQWGYYKNDGSNLPALNTAWAYRRILKVRLWLPRSGQNSSVYDSDHYNEAATAQYWKFQ